MAEEAQTQGAGGSSNNILTRAFTELLAPEQRALLGTLFFFIAIIATAWAMVNEPVRLSTYDDQFLARSIERGAVIFDGNCSTCHGLNGEGIQGRGPILNHPPLFDGTRLEEVGWAGSNYDFVYVTVSGGRPVMSDPTLYAEPMPTWGEEYGGPLRADQVRDVVNFVMNWSTPVEGAPTPTPSGPTPTPVPVVGSDVDAALAAIAELEPDTERGRQLLVGELPSPVSGRPLGCQGCHAVEGEQTIVGPAYALIPQHYAAVSGDYDTLDRYLVESILLPANYFVPGFEGVLMPANFGEQLDAQSLADIVGYLKATYGE